MNATPNPTEIRLNRDKDRLTVAFGDSGAFEFTAEFLRVTSPSAEVRGHSASGARTVGGRRGVKILTVQPVGNYAVRLGFDDGHSSGLYSWDFFLTNGREMDQVWSDYLAELDAKGMDRDTPAIR
jgi:DUF971 family protein